MIRESLKSVLAIVVMASTAGGCTTTPTTFVPSSTTFVPPPNHILRELCDPLSEFFTRDLQAVGTTIRADFDMTKSIDTGGWCYVDTNFSDVMSVGYISRTGASGDDPTAKDPAFHPMSGTSAPVWMLDERPHGGVVELVTRSGSWDVRIRINEERTKTANGPLKTTDEQLRQAAELIIRLAHMK